MAAVDSGARPPRDKKGGSREGRDHQVDSASTPDAAADRPGEERERTEGTLRERLESMVPETVKRAMLTGLGALFVTEETIRSAVSEMRLPKEAVSFVMQQADNTKDQLFRHVARELREFVEKSDLAREIPRLLANMVIEVKSEIRFVANPDAPGIDARPTLRTDVTVKTDRSRQNDLT